MAIKINLSTPTIDFDFGGILLTADVSDQALSHMLDLEKSEEFKKASKESERLKDLRDEDLTTEEFNELLQKAVDTYGLVYAPMFGEDAFQKVYDHAKSIVATVDAFDQALTHITEHHENQKSNEYRKRKKK